MTPRKRSPAAPTIYAGRLDHHEYPLPLTIGVLSDTHIFSVDGPRRIPVDVLELFRRFQVDLIVHGGDIVIQEVLDQLAEVAPVVAVHGNNEPLSMWKTLPERIVLDVGKFRIGIVHGHGQVSARVNARSAFDSSTNLVIYGHSHIPMIESEDGVVYFNPGSPTDRRWSPHFGVGIVTVDDKGIRPELILFDSPAHLASITPNPPSGVDA